MESEVSNRQCGEGVGLPAVRSELQPRPQWIPDERDGFIFWLRGEFAAANAIIDALCQHLQVTGLPGEYDYVLACIQNRRFNWNPILHMQQYYSVAEVLMALQQVSMKKHQTQVPIPRQYSSGEMSEAGNNVHPVKRPATPLNTPQKNPVISQPPEFNQENFPDALHRKHVQDSKKASDLSEEASKSSHAANRGFEDSNSSRKASTVADEANMELAMKVSAMSIAQEASKSFHAAPKYFVGFEEIEGQQVNMLEGLQLYENIVDTKMAAELGASFNESHTGKSKNTGGNKRSPGKGVIQFGTITSEIVTEEQSAPTVSSEGTVEEGIPAFADPLVDHLLKLHIIPADKRPDACSVSILDPGEYTLLGSCYNFEQPVYVLALGSHTQLTFGRNLKLKSTGEVEGPFKLTLPPGSLLMLQRNSLEMVQCGVSPSREQRLILTFGKLRRTIVSTPERNPSADANRKRDSSQGSSPNEPIESKIIRETQAFFPHSLSPPPTILPISPARSPVQPPIIVAPLSPSAGWTGASVRVPTSLGTGVFLPANGSTVHTPMNGFPRRQVPAPPFGPH